METLYYSDGTDVHISNARVTIGNLTIPVRNIASVESGKTRKAPIAAYIVASLGFLLWISGMTASEPAMMTIGFLFLLVGVLVAIVLRPRHQVLIVTNAGEQKPVFKGPRSKVSEINQAINQAIVAIHAPSAEVPQAQGPWTQAR